MTSEGVPWGRVIAEALTVIVRVDKDLIQLVMNDEDYSALEEHVGASGLEPQAKIGVEVREGHFLGVVIRSGPKARQGKVTLIKKSDVTQAEYRIVWEVLHGIPPTRFDRINFDRTE